MPVTTTYSHGTFSFPGLASGNAAAARAFYSALLGWQPHEMQTPGGKFTMFKVKDAGVAGMYEVPATRIQAGVKPHWNSYLAVDDVASIAQQCEALGGKVSGAPFDADGDLMANLQDPLGAKFSVWQARKPNQEPALLMDTGALCWTELYTTDVKRASDFYTQLLGWRAGAFDQGPMPYTMFTPAGLEQPQTGMVQITEQMPGMVPQWVPYFMVEDADATSVKARELGAQVKGPFDIPTIGRMAMAHDMEGALFAYIKLLCP